MVFFAHVQPEPLVTRIDPQLTASAADSPHAVAHAVANPRSASLHRTRSVAGALLVLTIASVWASSPLGARTAAAQQRDPPVPSAAAPAQAPSPPDALEISAQQRAVLDAANRVEREIVRLAVLRVLGEDLAAARERQAELDTHLAALLEAEHVRPERTSRLRERALQDGMDEPADHVEGMARRSARHAGIPSARAGHHAHARTHRRHRRGHRRRGSRSARPAARGLGAAGRDVAARRTGGGAARRAARRAAAPRRSAAVVGRGMASGAGRSPPGLASRVDRRRRHLRFVPPRQRRAARPAPDARVGHRTAREARRAILHQRGRMVGDASAPVGGGHLLIDGVHRLALRPAPAALGGRDMGSTRRLGHRPRRGALLAPHAARRRAVHRRHLSALSRRRGAAAAGTALPAGARRRRRDGPRALRDAVAGARRRRQ